MFKRNDGNHDGKLTLEEFQEFMHQHDKKKHDDWNENRMIATKIVWLQRKLFGLSRNLSKSPTKSAQYAQEKAFAFHQVLIFY